MKKILDLLLSVVYAIFPTLQCNLANRKVKRQITQQDLKNSEAPSLKKANTSLETLKEKYNEGIKQKDSLEGKAKTSIVGITIAVTLILGYSSFLSGLLEKLGSKIAYYCAIILFIAAVAYMLISALHSMRLIINENIVYDPNILNQDQQEEYRNAIGLNQLQNIVRNNHAWTSYACIRNSLICLFIVMFIGIIPLIIPRVENKPQEVYSDHTFLFTQESIDVLENNNITDKYIEKIILDKIDDEKEEDPITIIDQTKKLVIEFSVNNENVDVYQIAVYRE